MATTWNTYPLIYMGTIVLWLMEGPPIQLWKTNVDFLQNFLLESPAMFNVAQFGAMMQ